MNAYHTVTLSPCFLFFTMKYIHFDSFIHVSAALDRICDSLHTRTHFCLWWFAVWAHRSAFRLKGITYVCSAMLCTRCFCKNSSETAGRPWSCKVRTRILYFMTTWCKLMETTQYISPVVFGWQTFMSFKRIAHHLPNESFKLKLLYWKIIVFVNL